MHTIVLLDIIAIALFVLAVSLLVCNLILHAFWHKPISVTMLRLIATPLSIFSICSLLFCRIAHMFSCLCAFAGRTLPFSKTKLPRLKRARFIGTRRYRHPRKRHHRKDTHMRILRRYLWFMFVNAAFIWQLQLAWCISRKARNKRMHATYGNGGPPKGKGRGKSAGKASGKQSQPVVETL